MVGGNCRTKNSECRSRPSFIDPASSTNKEIKPGFEQGMGNPVKTCVSKQANISKIPSWGSRNLFSISWPQGQFVELRAEFFAKESSTDRVMASSQD